MGSLFKRKTTRTDGSVHEGAIWWLKYRVAGRPVRESSGTTKESVARRLLRQREGDIEHGIPINPRMGRVMFHEAAQAILDDYTANEHATTAKVEERIALHLEPVFRGRRMLAIDTTTVRAYISQRRAEGAKNATIVRELAILKRMFTLCVQAKLLHAAPYIPMPRENNARAGFFEREQFEAVRDHLPPDLRPVVTFAYLTGWRVPSEVLTRQWHHVDRRAHIVRLEPFEAKNDDGRTFPYDLLPELAAVIEAQWQAHERLQRAGAICPWVFHRDGQPIKSFYGAWHTACRAAGVAGRIPHDFRRTAVRNLIRAGVPEKTAMVLTGHKTRSVFDRYDIVSEADLRSAVQKLAGSIAGTIGRSADQALNG